MAQAAEPERIDREALVRRHNPTLSKIDPSSPLMIGNGDIAFSLDITGLQTFPEQYSPLVPLMTLSSGVAAATFEPSDCIAPRSARTR